VQTVPGNVTGSFTTTPKGVILHGSRSGSATNTTQQEYTGTVNYVRGGADGLGWHATIGDDAICIHLPPDKWGYSAFAASQVYLAVEFAQPLESRLISDGQVRAFGWWFLQTRTRWPQLPLHFPTHAEVEHSGEIQHAPSGKTDVFSYGSIWADELRARIVAEIVRQGG
jgi:hypothetical protein